MATTNDRLILNSIFNPNLPLGECLVDDQELVEGDVEIETPDILEAKRLEREGVEYAEKGNFSEAIEVFTKAIQLIPTRSSGYNNRAQAYRLSGNNDDALQDLNTAVELSKGKGETAGKSLCQRGLLHQLRGDHEDALRDFQAAAKQGSEFGRTMAVQLNPYAALCNQMLTEVMRKLKDGQPLQ